MNFERRWYYKPALALLALTAVALLAVLAFEWRTYDLKARVAAANRAAFALRAQIGQRYLATGRMPAGGGTLGNPKAVADPGAASGPANTSPRQAQQQGYSIAIDAGTITITFAGDQGPLAGKTLVHRPRFVQNRVEWDCAGGTLDYQYRTPECTHQ